MSARFAGQSRCPGWRGLGVALLMPMAWGQTALENEIRQQPLPHALVTGPPEVPALRATMIHVIDGEGAANNAQSLAALKAAVAFCMVNRLPTSPPTHPPTEWPQYRQGTREDSYATERYAITYRSTWAYGNLNDDCSHLVGQRRTAELRSAAGLCTIDLTHRTAKGVCDLSVHLKAPLSPLGRRTSGTEAPQRNLPTGEPACQTLPDGIGGTVCAAIGGPFTPAYPLVLKRQSPGLVTVHSEADLNLHVSSQVFSPHAQGRFSVTGRRP